MPFEPKLINEEFTPTLSSDGRIVRTYKDTYLCTNDSRLSGMQVLAALGISQGSPHRDDNLATVRSAPVKRRMVKGVSFAWDVTVDYSTETPQIQSPNQDDPTQLRIKRWWSTTEEQRYIIKDRFGKLILNTAKEPPVGGIPVNVELPTLIYERNEADFSGEIARLWSGSINQSKFCGWDIGQVKLKVTGEEVYEQRSHYWRVRYEFICDTQGWNPKWVNSGLREWDPINRKLIPCLDGNLQPVTEPVPLDSSGFQIPADSLPDAAIFNDVDYRIPMEFAKLGLPQI